MPDSGFLPGLDHGTATPGPRSSVWDAVPDGIVLLRPTGTITLANRAACSMLGWALDEVLGQPFDIWWPRRTARRSPPRARAGTRSWPATAAAASCRSS